METLPKNNFSKKPIFSLLLIFILIFTLSSFLYRESLPQKNEKVLGVFDSLKKLIPSRNEKEKEKASPSPQILEETKVTPSLKSGGGGITTANPILPSVTGFATDKFTGAATVSHPFALPPGPGGLSPSLALSYSSGSVADSYNGVSEWERKYYHQASWVGLGWNLGGLGYIARDPGSWKDTKIGDHGVKDDRFYLVFPGGSAELVNGEDYEVRSDQWKTEPNLFLKIKHQHQPQGGSDGCHTIGYDTQPWEITTKDGTKYYFGSPISTGGEDKGRFCSDEACTQIFATSEESAKLDVGSGGDVLLNKNKKGQEIPDPSLATEYGYAYCAKDGKAYNRLLPHRWLLRKIVDTHGNTIEIKYEARVKELKRETSGSWCPKDKSGKWCPDFYTHDIAPRQIVYSHGHITIDLIRESRDDYEIEKYDDKYHVNFWSKHRLKEIQVKVDGRIARKYVLDYGEKAWRCKGNEEFHGLLTSITQYGLDGAGTLPPYTFTYDNGFPTKGRGCSGGCRPGTDYPCNNHFNNVLLKTADNGFGGKVTFEYDYVVPPVCLGSTSRECREQGWCCVGSEKAAEYGSYRARVKKKTVEDGTGNSYQITYDYSDGGKAFVKTQIDSSHKIPYTGYRFLGYSQVGEKLYALNEPDRVETLTKSYYYDQLNDGWDGGSDDDYSCFRPDPRSGRARKVEIADTSGKVLSISESKFLVRPLGTEFSCSQVSSSGAYFVAPKETIQTIDNKTSKVEYTLYDEYGNLMEIVHHGDVSVSGDEKTFYTDYYPSETKWILGLPAWTNTYQGDTRGNPGGENLMAQAINYYDGATDYHRPPEKGDLTMVQQGKSGETDVDGCLVYGLLSTRFEYDPFGNQTKVIDPLGNEAETAYDSAYKTYPTDTYNPLRHHTHIEYNFVLGVPLAITDPNGQTTNIEYDTFGRRTKVLQPTLSGLGSKRPEVQFEYFDQREKGAPASVLTKVKKASGRFLSSIIHYNGWGQEIQSQSEWEEDGALISNTTYNSLGKIKNSYLPFKASGGVDEYRTLRPATPYTQSFYDALARVIKTTNFDGTENRNEYSGWTVISSDEESHKTLVENDAYGQTIKAQSFDERDSVYTTTTTKYDVLGNLLEAETEGHKVTATYDSHSWKLTSDDPDLGYYQYCYDKNGNLSWQKTPKDQVINFEYDALNRLTKKTLPDGSTVVYRYDHGANKIGRLASQTSPDVIKEPSYDELGRVVKMEKAILGNHFGTEFSYNLLGALSTITYPDGELVENIYDDLGRLTQVRGDDVYVSGVGYTPYGEIKNLKLGNGTETNYTYHEENRQLIGISSPVLDYSYTYDKVGNLKSWHDSKSDWHLAFNYDQLYRLVSAQGALYNTSYSYDKLDRMFSKNEEERLSIHFDDNFPLHAPKKMGSKKAGSVDFQYDANGNLLSDGQRDIEWNGENQILSVTQTRETDPAEMKKLVLTMGKKDLTYDSNADGVVNSFDFTTVLSGQVTVRYAYDGDGVRVLRESPGEKKIYVNQYFSKDLITDEIEKYYFAGGKRVAVRETIP